MTDRMTIGDVARRTGVSIKALRFYDELGILEVDGRSKSNYRLFTEAVLRCVADIRRFQEAGLTLRQVQDLVRRARGGEDPELVLRSAYVGALARTEREIAALEKKRERLRSLVGPPASTDLTLQCTGGCSLSDENAPHAAHGRRRSWPPQTSGASATS